MYPAEELGKDQMAIMPDGRGFANISGQSTSLSQIDNGRKMIPLQYTGLKDKNGKEIYEGDNLSGYRGRGLTRDRESLEGYVYWDEGAFGWSIQAKDSQYCLFNIIEPEVIGNIYENPELMEK